MLPCELRPQLPIFLFWGPRWFLELTPCHSHGWVLSHSKAVVPEHHHASWAVFFCTLPSHQVLCNGPSCHPALKDKVYSPSSTEPVNMRTSDRHQNPRRLPWASLECPMDARAIYCYKE